MQYHTVSCPEDEPIWEEVCSLAGKPFFTSRGLPFTFHRKTGRDGAPLNELVIDRKEKTITRNTVLLAYRKAAALQAEEGCVSGPKKLGCFGASYLYPVFLKLGVCTGGKKATGPEEGSRNP